MKSGKGFTLLEMVIGLAITGVLASVAAAAIPMLMQWVPRQANKLVVEEDLSFARYWLTRDANAAESFIPLSSPQYGMLYWRDYNGATMVSYNVTYSYDNVTDSLIREERQDNVIQTSLPIARKILSSDNVQFSWSPGTRQLTANITATIEDAPGVGTHSRSATFVTNLRPLPESTVSPPSDLPTPPPVPGSITYYVSANPTVITGTYVSGTYTSLHDADTNYYVVNSASVPGSKRVAWSAVSETMNNPPTISQIQVTFTGKSSSKNVILEFYVKNSDAGFPATPESGFTFTQADTDTTRSFIVSDSALAYINSLPQRQVTLKIVANTNANFTLSTNQVIFIASPP